MPKQKSKRLFSSSSTSLTKEVTTDSDSNHWTKTQTDVIKHKINNNVQRRVDSEEEFVEKVITPSKSPSSTVIKPPSPSKKFKQIIAKPIVDSSDEFTKPKTLKPTTQKTPSRRSTRLQSVKEDLCSPTKRRSTQDFLPKTPFSHSKSSPQKNKKPKRSSIVCTRFHNTEVQVFQQIVKKLGVFFVEDEVSDKTTHLVAAESRRTVNLLRAMARGCWVLRSEWVIFLNMNYQMGSFYYFFL